MALFSTAKKRSVSADVKTPKAPAQPKAAASKKAWDNYALKLAEYNKKVEAVNKEKGRRKQLVAAKAIIDRKKK